MKFKFDSVRRDKRNMSDLKTVLKNLGGIFIIIGFVTLIAILVPLYFGEFGPNTSYDAISPIIITSVLFYLSIPHVFYLLFVLNLN